MLGRPITGCPLLEVSALIDVLGAAVGVSVRGMASIPLPNFVDPNSRSAGVGPSRADVDEVRHEKHDVVEPYFQMTLYIS